MLLPLWSCGLSYKLFVMKAGLRVVRHGNKQVVCIKIAQICMPISWLDRSLSQRITHSVE